MKKKFIIILSIICISILGGVYFWIILPDIVYRFTPDNIVPPKCLTIPRTKKQEAIQEMRRLKSIHLIYEDDVENIPSSTKEFENYKQHPVTGTL